MRHADFNDHRFVDFQRENPLKHDIGPRKRRIRRDQAGFHHDRPVLHDLHPLVGIAWDIVNNIFPTLRRDRVRAALLNFRQRLFTDVCFQ